MTYASVSRWSWWAHGNPPSWGLLWVTVYTRLRPVPRKHVECVVCKHTLFFKCLRIDLGVFSHKPSGQPTHSLASSFERRKFPAAQVRNRWSTQAPPGTGAGGLWGGSWGAAAGLEASAHKHASQCPQWILGSHSSTVPLYLCFPCLSSTRQMKRQVLFLFFNFLRPKPLNHLWHISFFSFPMWKSVITYCRLCFQTGARIIWSLGTSSTATTLVQVTIVSCPDYWSGFLTIFSCFRLPSKPVLRTLRVILCKCTSFLCSKPSSVSHFIWDKIQTLHHGLQKSFLIALISFPSPPPCLLGSTQVVSPRNHHVPWIQHARSNLRTFHFAVSSSKNALASDISTVLSLSSEPNVNW